MSEEVKVETVTLDLPVEPLKRLRDAWEHLGEVGAHNEMLAALRDLFEGGDGTLHTVNRVCGFSGWV